MSTLYSPVVKPASEQQIAAKLIPYFAWNNGAIPQMSAWLPSA
jgi:DUF1680 family protein